MWPQFPTRHQKLAVPEARRTRSSPYQKLKFRNTSPFHNPRGDFYNLEKIHVLSSEKFGMMGKCRKQSKFEIC
jgi:hypothetical protein